MKHRHYLTLLFTCAFFSSGCSTYVLDLTEAETLGEGNYEISAAGVPSLDLSGLGFNPSFGIIGAYGLSPNADLRIGFTAYTEVIESVENTVGSDNLFVQSGSGYGFGVGTKIELYSYELFQLLGFEYADEMDWAIDLPLGVYKENSGIGDGIVFAPALIATIPVDESLSYSIVHRWTFASTRHETGSDFRKSTISFGATRYLENDLILRFNLQADLFRLFNGYISPGIGLAYRL